MTTDKKPIVISLCSGVGGMDLGFEQAGFRIALAIESNPTHVDAYISNAPTVPTMTAGIETVGVKAIRQRAGLSRRSDIDVVIGGPPCQGFSIAGKRDPNDPRSTLVSEFVRIVGEVRPRFFVLENVKGLTMGSCKAVLDGAIADFKEAGYTCTPWQILDAQDYGVPQHRERLFLLGSRCDMPLIKYPKRSGKRIKCGDVLYSIPASASHQEPTNHSPTTLARFGQILPGEREPVSHLVRLRDNGVSPTLRAGTVRPQGSKSGRFTAVRPIHPREDRVVSVRESATLHGYPHTFQFSKTKCDALMQIGNSVPPPLAKAVAGEVLRAIEVYEQG